MKIVNDYNPFPANIHLSHPLKTRKNLCFSGVFRAYKIGASARKWDNVKGFDKVGHVGLPDKTYSCDIFWNLFHHILSFLNGKKLLIHLNRNSSSE